MNTLYRHVRALTGIDCKLDGKEVVIMRQRLILALVVIVLLVLSLLSLRDICQSTLAVVPIQAKSAPVRINSNPVTPKDETSSGPTIASQGCAPSIDVHKNNRTERALAVPSITAIPQALGKAAPDAALSFSDKPATTEGISLAKEVEIKQTERTVKSSRVNPSAPHIGFERIGSGSAGKTAGVTKSSNLPVQNKQAPATSQNATLKHSDSSTDSALQAIPGAAITGVIPKSASQHGELSSQDVAASRNHLNGSYSTTALPNGNVLYSGGGNVGNSYVKTCDIYDTLSGTYLPAASMHYARALSKTFVLPSGNVLLTSGIGIGQYGFNDQVMAESELYDPVLDQWTYVGAFSGFRYMNTCQFVLLNTRNILLFGGTGEGPFGTGATATCQLFDLSTNSWRSTGSLSQSRSGPFYELLSNGNVLCAGGTTNDDNWGRVPATLLEVYDVGTEQWHIAVPPVSNDGAFSTLEDIAVSGFVTGTAPEGTKRRYQIVSPGSKGTAIMTDNDTGAFTYTPNFCTYGTDTFTFVTSDEIQTSLSATVTVTISHVNHAPDASSNNVSIHFNHSLPVTLSASDCDGDPLTYAILSQPQHGTLSGSLPNMQYSPDEHFVGTDSFTFKANDGTADSNVATVAIQVTDTAPVTNPQTVSTHFNTPLAITLLATDTNLDLLTFSAASPAHGTLTGIAPNLVYTPAAAFVGSDSFTFTANDDALDSNASTISILVTDTAPVSDFQTLNTHFNTPIAITLLAADSDHDGFTFSMTPPAHGMLSGIAPNLTYTPAYAYVGQDSFTFNANDAALDGNVAAVTINVTDTAPVADPQNLATNTGDPLAVTLGSLDADADSLSFAVIIPPSHGALSGTGSNLAYSPSTGYFGTDSFTFKTNDGALDSNIAAVNIIVHSLIVTNTDDVGSGSLRSALQNSLSGDTITFDPTIFSESSPSASTVINTFSELPPLVAGNVTIDAQNVRVTVNGTGAGSSNGFTLSSNNNRILGVSVVGFTRSGIYIASGGNLIGGSRASGSGPNGQGCRSSGNGAFGIEINGGCGNVIKGCWIGLSANGTAAEPNLGGIIIRNAACANTTGSTADGEENVISGNTFEGIVVTGSGSNDNLILGNFIGVAAGQDGQTSNRGTSARPPLPNGSTGIFVTQGAQRSTVGGVKPGEGNVIGYNGRNGIEIHDAISASNSVRANEISRNVGKGIALFDGSNGGIAAPQISAVTATPATSPAGLTHVLIAGASPANGVVDVYSDPGTQGGAYLGSVIVQDGVWQLESKINTAQNITATLTDMNGNTSPFAIYSRASIGGSLFTSPPSVALSQGLVGSALSFSAAATPGGVITFNFGDGTSATGASTNASHVYAAPGSYLVTITATDANGLQTSKTLSVVVNSSASYIDNDHDGFSDELENALGSSPISLASSPYNIGPVTPKPLTISKVMIRLNFAKTQQDSITLSGTLPTTANFNPVGQHVAVDVGGVVVQFILDKTGKGETGPILFKVQLNKSNGAAFQVRLAKGSFAAALADEGLTGGADLSKTSREVLVNMIFNHAIYQKLQPLLYSATAKTMGNAK